MAGKDNAVGFAHLPFAFRFFDQVYPEGTKVTVCTNGWLSFASVGAEYQNAPLPGSTVSHADGSTGSIPPAMIAPYFGDLYVRTGLFGSSGREICVKTFGEAPGRAWVVEWSKMGMYAQGVDLGDRLSFEGILYEGSNDIQFVSAVLSGSTADGARTTVGFQDAGRSRAVQSGYRESILTEGTSLTYHFEGGNYLSTKISKEISYQIPPNGGFFMKTVSTHSELTVGYATISSETEKIVPAGLAILGLKVDGVTVSETSVPVSTPLTSGITVTEASVPAVGGSSFHAVFYVRRV